MPEPGDKVGDAYIEVHAEVDKKAMARAQKQLEASALKAEKQLSAKQRQQKVYTTKFLEREQKKALDTSFRNDVAAIKKIHGFEIKAEREHLDKISQMRVKALANEARRRQSSGGRGRRFKDGGRPGAGEVVENLISILPGQLEKVFRDPKIASVAIAGGTAIGTFLLAGIGGAIGAAGGGLALLGGVGLAISASKEFQEQGQKLGMDLLSGLQESALNQLGPAIQASFDQLEGTNFSDRVVGTFNRIFANVKDDLVPFVANIDGALSRVLAGFENLSAGATPFLRELGGGINRLGGAVGDLFTKVGKHPELADALNDVFDLTVNLTNGFGDLVVKAGEFWQVLKNIKDLEIGEALKGISAAGNTKLEASKDDSFFQQLLTGSWLDKADSDVEKRIAEARAAGSDAVKQSAEMEHQNYNTQRSQALLNDAARFGSAATAKQAAAFDRAEVAAKDYADAVETAFKESRDYNNEVLRGLDAQLDFANGQAELKEQFKGNNDTISLNTKRGRENRAVLLDQVAAARDQAQAVYEQTGNADKANAKYKELTDKILAATGATGKNRDAIKEVIDKLIKFKDLPVDPKVIQVKIDAAGLNGVKAQLAELTKSQTKTIFAEVKKKGIPLSEALAAERKNRASGGAVFGPGTATSDSIPANLSNGEFVIKASSAKKIGYGNLARMNATGQGVAAFASGGRVGRGSTGTEKRAFEALLKQISILTKTVSAQTKALEAYNNQLSASREQFKSFVNLGALDTQGKTTGDVLQQLQARKSRAGAFTKQLAGLKRRGLSSQALAQIAEAGPDSDIARLVAGGSAYDIGLINSLLTGDSSYAASIGKTIFPKGPGTAKSLAANKKRLAAKKKAAAKLKPVRAKGATISYAGGRTTALFSSKELQQQQLKTGTYVTVVIDGKEVRAIVKEEQRKVSTKANRQMKSGRK